MMYREEIKLFDNKTDKFLGSFYLIFQDTTGRQIVDFFIVNSLACFKHFEIQHAMKYGNSYHNLADGNYASAGQINPDGTKKKGFPKPIFVEGDKRYKAISSFRIKTQDFETDLYFRFEKAMYQLFFRKLFVDSLQRGVLQSSEHYVLDKGNNWRKITLYDPHGVYDNEVLKEFPYPSVVKTADGEYDQSTKKMQKTDKKEFDIELERQRDEETQAYIDSIFNKGNQQEDV